MVKRAKRKKPNAHGRDERRFIKLDHGVIDSVAFSCLSGNAVKLLIYLWRRHNGRNNGKISFSTAEAKNKLQTGNDQAVRTFRELAAKGFIKNTRPSSFTIKAKHAREWELTTEGREGEQATRDFQSWRSPKKNAVPGEGTDGSSIGNRRQEKVSRKKLEKARPVPDPGIRNRLNGSRSRYTYSLPSDRNICGLGRVSGADGLQVDPARIVEMRKGRGLTQASLAEQIGLSRSYIAAIEQGRRALTPKVYAAITDLLIEDPLVRRHLPG